MKLIVDLDEIDKLHDGASVLQAFCVNKKGHHPKCDRMVLFVTLSDILTPEQRIESHVKQAGNGNQQCEIRVGKASLPFGDRLYADAKVPGKLTLRHVSFQP